MQPIIVRKKNENYQIITGERRFRAAGLAGIFKIPVIIKELSDHRALETALIENIQRQDLDPLEEASAYQNLLQNYHHTQQELAKALGKNRATIANSLRLLNLPPSVQKYIAKGLITAGHARALMMLKNKQNIEFLAKESVKKKWSVRVLEKKSKEINQKPKKAAKKSIEVIDLEKQLTTKLKTKIQIHQTKGKGYIKIFFHNQYQLDSILKDIAQ